MYLMYLSVDFNVLFCADTDFLENSWVLNISIMKLTEAPPAAGRVNKMGHPTSFHSADQLSKARCVPQDIGQMPHISHQQFSFCSILWNHPTTWISPHSEDGGGKKKRADGRFGCTVPPVSWKKLLTGFRIETLTNEQINDKEEKHTWWIFWILHLYWNAFPCSAELNPCPVWIIAVFSVLRTSCCIPSLPWRIPGTWI